MINKESLNFKESLIIVRNQPSNTEENILMNISTSIITYPTFPHKKNNADTNLQERRQEKNMVG
jgi:hypothetical protein